MSHWVKFMCDQRLLGLTRNQSAVYLQIVARIPYKTGEVSLEKGVLGRATKLDRRRISEIIQALTKKGLLRTSTGHGSDEILYRLPLVNPTSRTPTGQVPDKGPITHYINILDKECSQEELFQEAWVLYPRDAGKAKAKEKWLRLSFDEAVEVYTVLVGWCSLWKDQTKEALQFCPHFTTYLNQRRWEDAEQPTPSKTNGAAQPAMLKPVPLQ